MDNPPAQQIKEIIMEILNQMEVSATVEIEEAVNDEFLFNIHTDETQVVIGRQGVNLHALQLIVTQIALRRMGYGNVPRFSLDVDDYQKKRIWFIKEMAKGAAEKVKKFGQTVTMEPMPNYERKVVHSYIQENFPEIESFSTGDGPERKVVIEIRK